MAIINIPAYHLDYRTIKTDSKGALMKAFAKNFRLPQFINGKNKDNYPYISAFEDIIKDFGLQPKKIFDKTLTPSDNWYGVKQVQNAILISKMEYGKKPQIKIVGETSEWMSLEDFNRKAASGNLFTSLSFKEKKYEVVNAYYENKLKLMIKRELEENPSKKFYFVFDAALRRKVLKTITNPKCSIFSKPFVDDERIEYIRYNSTDDIAEMDIYKMYRGKMLISRASGLFYDDDCLYAYSLASKSDNMQGKYDLNKETSGEEAISRPFPRELFVYGVTDKEKRKEIFEKVHRLRNASITFKQELGNVAPLYYLENIKKYLKWQ